MIDKLKSIVGFVNNFKMVPVWLFKDNKLIFTSARRDGLRGDDEIFNFFKFFIDAHTDTPTITLVNDIELFSSFEFSDKGEIYSVVVGPVFNIHPVRENYKNKLSFHLLYFEEFVKDVVLLSPTTEIDEFCLIIQFFLGIMAEKYLTIQELKTSLKNVELQKIINQKLVKMIFEIREEDALSYYSYDNEKKFLSIVRRGDVETLHNRPSYRAPGVRNPLAPDTVKQFAYEVVAMATLCTRAAVDGGLDVDTAFSLSDLYLEEIGNAKNREELVTIARNMIRNFTEKVAEVKLKSTGEFSPYIEQAIVYIKKHLHYPITLANVADYVGLSEKHLSKIFIDETKDKFTAFIQKERVKEACELLNNTTYTYSQISNFLSFSSQSYFIKVFTSVMGVSPLEYRKAKRVEK